MGPRVAAPILLDGATGTELARRGLRMDAPLWSAHALIEAPEAVEAIHRDYLRAGAQVITTNTFRTHARDLAAGGRAAEAGLLTARAVARARSACAAHRREAPGAVVRVAGSMSPIVDCFRPQDSPGAAAEPEHRAMAEDLVAAGCELLLIETMSRVDEAVAALRAAQGLGVPVWLAVVCRADGRLLAGETLAELVAAARGLSLQALLVGCTELGHLGAALPALVAAAGPGLALGTYPHTGRQEAGGFVTHAAPIEAFADAAAGWAARAGLAVVGSCCGSTPAWTAALRRRLYPDPAREAEARARLAAWVPARG